MNIDAKINSEEEKKYSSNKVYLNKLPFYPSLSGGYNLLQMAFALIVLGLLSVSFIQIYSIYKRSLYGKRIKIFLLLACKYNYKGNVVLRASFAGAVKKSFLVPK